MSAGIRALSPPAQWLRSANSHFLPLIGFVLPFPTANRIRFAKLDFLLV